MPNALDLAKTDDTRQLIKAGIIDPGTIVRALSLPPGTPKAPYKSCATLSCCNHERSGICSRGKEVSTRFKPPAGHEVEKMFEAFSTCSPAS